MHPTHSYPSIHPPGSCTHGCKGLCNWSCLASLAFGGINVGTRKFFWCNKTITCHLVQKQKALQPGQLPELFFASLHSVAQATFHESSFKAKVYRHSQSLLCLWRYKVGYSLQEDWESLADFPKLAGQSSFWQRRTVFFGTDLLVWAASH